MIQCPSCERRQEPHLICQQCGAPLAVPSDLDCFSALGFPKKLSIDLPLLESTYHDLGRKIHPDRFASASPQLRDASMRATALLTRSYRTLRDPVSRGLYWLEVNGDKLSENNKNVPTELAAMVFEVQEQLVDLHDAAGDAATELRDEIENRRKELSSSMDESNEQLARNFARWDSNEGSRDELTKELKAVLSKIAYLRTLIRDVDRALENQKAA